jgi:hypothetical protein
MIMASNSKTAATPRGDMSEVVCCCCLFTE